MKTLNVMLVLAMLLTSSILVAKGGHKGGRRPHLELTKGHRGGHGGPRRPRPRFV